MSWHKQRWIAYVRRVARRLILALAWIPLVIGLLWATGALWFDITRLPWLAGLLCLTFFALCATAVAIIRPVWRAQLALLGLFLLILVGWFFMPASNDRVWNPAVARVARADIAGNELTIHNVRNFAYRGENDYTERWETRSYDLDKLLGVNIALCFWGPTLIAHTIASWEFSDGPPLAISIETRKELGETYSALRGIYRQYELYYVVADERDVTLPGSRVG